MVIFTGITMGFFGGGFALGYVARTAQDWWSCQRRTEQNKPDQASDQPRDLEPDPPANIPDSSNMEPPPSSPGPSPEADPGTEQLNWFPCKPGALTDGAKRSGTWTRVIGEWTPCSGIWSETLQYPGNQGKWQEVPDRWMCPRSETADVDDAIEDDDEHSSFPLKLSSLLLPSAFIDVAPYFLLVDA